MEFSLNLTHIVIFGRVVSVKCGEWAKLAFDKCILLKLLDIWERKEKVI